MYFIRTPTFLITLRAISSLASAAPAYGNDDNSSTFYKNISRTIGGETVSLAVSCSSLDITCATWCLTLPVTDALKSDCEQDCQDDFCATSSATLEFPQNSGIFVSQSELMERARDEDLQRLQATSSAATSLERSLHARAGYMACMRDCVAFYVIILYLRRRFIPKSIAMNAARRACPAFCYDFFVLGLYHH
jgi:hypothetical protein